MPTPVLIYPSGWGKPHRTKYARVVELVDSLDSGSSAHSGHAGSSPASRTKRKGHPIGCPISFCKLVGLERAALVRRLVQKLRAGEQFLARGKVLLFRSAVRKDCKTK